MKEFYHKDESEIEIDKLQEYSQKIKDFPMDPINYINRAYIFLKLKHYYYALEDAHKLITNLKCRSVIGFKLMSEIYNTCKLYEESLDILAVGLRMCKQSSRKELMLLKRETERKIRDRNFKEQKYMYVTLVVSCFVGLVASLSILYFPTSDFIDKNYSIVSISAILGIMLVGFVCYKMALQIKRGQRYNIAKPPYEALRDEEIEDLMRGDLSCITGYLDGNELKDGKQKTT